MSALKLLPAIDRPLEKLQNLGVKNLTDTELLAIIIHTGTKNKSVLEIARDLYNHLNSDELNRTARENLAIFDINELSKFEGIGLTKAARIIASVELGLRINEDGILKDSRILDNPSKIATWFRQKIDDRLNEVCFSLYLNIKNELIAYKLIAKGDSNKANINLKDICSQAIKVGSSRLVLCHNHPSGNCTPSTADLMLTKHLYKFCKLLDLDLLDHIIVGKNAFCSLVAEYNHCFTI